MQNIWKKQPVGSSDKSELILWIKVVWCYVTSWIKVISGKWYILEWGHD